MRHPLVLALFDDRKAAIAAARAVHTLGVDRSHLSIIARDHTEEGALAEEMNGSPGVDLEDSRPAALIGEVGGQILAAIALVLPGVGPIVAAGPLSARLGEAAGHVAGGLAGVLAHAGVRDASAWASRVEAGNVLLGVHVMGEGADEVRATLERQGARETARAEWE